MLNDILVGMLVAFSEYPFKKLFVWRMGRSYGKRNAAEVARFFVRQNAVICCEGIIHNANKTWRGTMRAANGKFLAEATSSCGVRSALRAVKWDDVLYGTWCKECFPEAAKVQRIVRGK